MLTESLAETKVSNSKMLVARLGRLQYWNLELGSVGRCEHESMSVSVAIVNKQIINSQRQ